MDLRISVLVENRKFAKAMRRVRVRLEQLMARFRDVEMQDSVFNTVLVGITDTIEEEDIKPVENNEDYFQVFLGCKLHLTDETLLMDVVQGLKSFAALCPMSENDKKQFSLVCDEHTFDCEE